MSCFNAPCGKVEMGFSAFLVSIPSAQIRDDKIRSCGVPQKHVMFQMKVRTELLLHLRRSGQAHATRNMVESGHLESKLAKMMRKYIVSSVGLVPRRTASSGALLLAVLAWVLC